MKGKIFTGKECLHVIFSDFHPSSIFQEEKGFLSFLSLDKKCHGFSAWWKLTCKVNFVVMRA